MYEGPSEEEKEEIRTRILGPPPLTPDGCVGLHLLQTSSRAELQSVSSEGNEKWELLETVVDSGAAESVAPPSVASSCPVQESEGSRRKVQYHTADGTTLNNLGEKHVTSYSETNDRLEMTFQR